MTEKEILEETTEIEPEEKSDDGVFRIRRSALYAMLIPLALVTGLAIGYLIWGQESALPVAAQQPGATEVQAAVAADATSQPAPPDLRSQQGQIRLEVSEDDDAVLGPESAPITIIEFSDYRCPFCKRWHNETLQPLFDRYEGQIRLIYRDFPVVGGFQAALAAECAAVQGDYYDYHDLLFSGQFEDLNNEAFAAYAEQLDLDPDQLLTCVDEGTFTEEVESDARYAASLGVTGTPTFFINGIPLVGAQPIDTFIQIIDAELAAQDSD
ncbi:MAG: DsbA family protein [Anaerolineales bacterium]|jgi:protein-disulfide isomerase